MQLEVPRSVVLIVPTDSVSRRRKIPRAAWRAFASAVVLIPPLQVHALAFGNAANVEDEAVEDGASAEALPQDSATTRPGSIADAGAGDAKLYGPPSPKVDRGRLAEISWPKAPAAVPAALEEAVKIVTRNYPSARSGRAALRAAASDVKTAKWLRFPSISGNLSYLDSDLKPEPQLIVEQPIWSGGRLSANIRRAKASENASSADYVATIEELALTATQTYFEIARLTRREQLLADSLREHLRLVRTMERRVEYEVSPLADLELARSRAAQVEQEHAITRSQRETALRVMAELIGDPSYDLGLFPLYDPEQEIENRDALEDQAVAFDPTLRRLAAEADVARADVDAKRASILPQVSAQFSHDHVFGSRVGVVLRAQSSGGLSQFSEISGARLRVQSVLEDRREAALRLRRTIASDIIEYEAARTRASISTQASETAARVSESYMRQFIAGRRSWLDVMNALREATTAQIGKSDAELSAMTVAARLLLRSGRWRPEFGGSDSSAVP
jgi:adhesin transport system outer membrane protein